MQFSYQKVPPGGDGAVPLIPAVRRQRQVDVCEFEAILLYRERESSRIARATQKPKKERRKEGKRDRDRR